MANKKPKILLLCNQRVREGYISPDELERMEAFANWAHGTQSGGSPYQPDQLLQWQSPHPLYLIVRLRYSDIKS